MLNTYAYHWQSVWQERAQDTRIELVWRLASAAYGWHRRNGHANFQPGQLAFLLGVTAPQLSNLIRKAKNLGLIDGLSCSRCLVVPPHAVTHGPNDAQETCAYHDGKRATTKKIRPHKPVAVTGRVNTQEQAQLQARGISAGSNAPSGEPIDLDSCRECDQPAKIDGLCAEHDRIRCEQSWKVGV